MTPIPERPVGTRHAERERLVLKERLTDPTLVDRATEVALGEEESAPTRLAVPVGGQRVAGEITVTGWTQTLSVLLALDGKPGSPHPRDADSGETTIDEPRTIRWGLDIGCADPDQRARTWGYHEAGRRAYTAEQNRYDARIPVTPLPENDLRTQAAPAGIYDVLFDGSDNYLADRRFVQSLPSTDVEALSVAAIINRLHMPAVIGRLTEQGIDQFLDLGCGIVPWSSPPSDPYEPYTNLQDLVARHQSTARLVYADCERRAFAVSRFTVEEHPLRPEWVQGDIRLMAQFLTSGRMQHLLDWNRPIGVLLHDVLPWIDSDQTVSEAMTVLREMLPPGSAVSLTHATDLGPNRMSRLTAPFADAGIPFKPRTTAAIGNLFGNWPVEPPGLVPPHHWHPTHPHTALDPHRAGALAGLAFKP
ncbi:DUF6302 family protein [Streptomyces olivaceus]|uniref:DUF6302 family protein n=1 Tax=Streptomyces olivaceus TaxID=47716 RepID=UPI00383087C5